MRIRVLLCAVSAYGLSCVSWHPAAAQNPSFDCNRAHLADEIAICRTPELAELDNIIAAAYTYLKSTRGRAYADEVGIPFWRLRQACQYDTGCIRQVQVQAISAYQAAGAPSVMPQPSMTGASQGTNAQSDPSAELHLCRNSNAAADKIAHCSNVIAQSTNASALLTAHNTRGLALMDASRFSEAIDDFTFVIRHEPQIAGFYDNRQNAYRRSGRLDEALKDANEAIRLAPTYSFVFRGRANVYNDMGKYALAVLDYDQAIRLAPNDGGLFIDRGKILRTQSKFDQAISDFSHALDLDKKWTAAYRERGLTYKLLGRSQEAIADLTTYDRLEPGDQEVALALAELGDAQELLLHVRTSGRDGVVPFWMEGIPLYVECRHLLVGDLDALGIGVGIEFAADFEAGFRRRVCDQFDGHEEADERHGAPVLGNVAEHAVLDLVPLRGPRRIMADLDDQAGLVGELLQRHLP